LIYRSIFMKRFLLLALVLLPWVASAQSAIDEAHLKALLAQNKAVVLDVRTAEEYAAGHIPGAQLLPFDAIDVSSASKFLPKKTTPVVVYCHSGRRSGIAAQTLLGLGYTQVLDFGAIAHWTGPLVAGRSPR
jgi:phage shock protein E